MRAYVPSSAPSTAERSIEAGIRSRSKRRFSLYATFGKRAVDVLLASALLVVTLPVLALTATLVLLSMGGPVLFRQERVGRRGDTFVMYKFRTMKHDRRRRQDPGYRGVDRRQTHKSDSDPRHTKVGKVLRRSSLDELPQLINVVKGDMSLVGPRPELRHVAEERGYLHHPRHAVRPGITGEYQISPLRSTGQLATGLHLDEDYARTVSLRNDVRILAQTPKALLGGS
jgi:lipopolysaccharide/colanic/teichoic acid biosynthesis glycosyltransferase